MNKTTPAAVAALSAVALLGAAAITALPTQAAPADPAPKQSAPAAAKKAVVTSCNGGPSRGLLTQVSADPFSFAGTSGADVAVPGAQVLLQGPKKGKDTLLITFSAESYYTGTGWMGLEVHRDGVPVQPFANNGSPFAFTSAAEYTGTSAQFCTKVGKGIHTINVQASTTGDNTESGWLDDWTFSVQRFD